MKEGRVVRGGHFVDIRDAGNPVENDDNRSGKLSIHDDSYSWKAAIKYKEPYIMTIGCGGRKGNNRLPEREKDTSASLHRPCGSSSENHFLEVSS
jgi:hypothetical protein